MLYLTAGLGYGIHSVLKWCPRAVVVWRKTLSCFSSTGKNFANPIQEVVKR